MIPTIQQFQKRIAHGVIDPGTLRNQGAPGVADAARRFLEVIDLAGFVTDSEAAFAAELDRQTELLRMSLPEGAQKWGAARKAINLLLEEACYHRFICTDYGLHRIENFLELPLDSQVANRLKKDSQETGLARLPAWPGIRNLNPPVSKQYQDFASVLADKKGMARIYLDVLIWARGQMDE